jgi:hypothetical protein
VSRKGENCGGSWIVTVADSSGMATSTTRIAPPPPMPLKRRARIADREADVHMT